MHLMEQGVVSPKSAGCKDLNKSHGRRCNGCCYENAGDKVAFKLALIATEEERHSRQADKEKGCEEVPKLVIRRDGVVKKKVAGKSDNRCGTVKEEAGRSGERANLLDKCAYQQG